MNQKNLQVYSIPTYDAAFKWILSEDDIRPSFFHAFIPDLIIQKSIRLDEHMSPLQLFQLLRNFVHDKDTEEVVEALKKSEYFEVHMKNAEKELRLSPSASRLLEDFITRFDDMQRAFPKQKFDGTMDFVCELSNGEYALVEMQVAPQDYWDERALAYVSAFFGNQLRVGGDWSKIKKVIGINILGGGKDNQAHWSNTPDQYVRHYRMEEQLHKSTPRFINGIELIQYSLANAPVDLDSQEKRDWITFFKNAQNLTEDEVIQSIKTPAVLRAFERAKIQALPGEVRKKYEEEDAEYDRYSIHTAEIAAKGKAEGLAEGLEKGLAEGLEKGVEIGKKEMALRLLKNGISISLIAMASGLSEQEIQAISLD